MRAASDVRRMLRKAEQGFSLVAAIFILVVLATLGGFIVSVSTNQQIGSALDVQGVRAYEAARSGVEWGLYQVNATAAYNFSYGTPAVAVDSVGPNTRACPASPSSFVPPAPTLAAFTVTVTCTATVDPNGGPTAFTIRSTACNQPSAGGVCPNTANPGNGYIERQLGVIF